jgi:uncharacterized lipoprotein YehR (DUF1307 family)
MKKTSLASAIIFSLSLISCGKSENAPEDSLKVQQKGDEVTYETSENDVLICTQV